MTPNQCPNCIHFIDEVLFDEKDMGFFKCKAFDRIPQEVLSGEKDHSENIEGDNGYKYTPS
jgi:hypothetical protein